MYSKYFTKEDQEKVNERFLHLLDNRLIGKEPYKPYKSTKEFAKAFGVTPQLISNFRSGKNNVTLPFLAGVTNMLGMDLDPREILVGEKSGLSNHGLPTGYVPIRVDLIGEISEYLELAKMKFNKITFSAKNASQI